MQAAGDAEGVLQEVPRAQLAVDVRAVGPRTSLAALVAAALETEAIGGVNLKEAFGSLDEVIERDLSADQGPELFCFGLRQAFDIADMEALVAPRPVQVERLGQFGGQ